MGIYVWGTGCGASELIEAGLSRERIAAFVDSYPMGDTFLGQPEAAGRCKGPVRL